jgi:uncharacterized membrane protein (DUF485 family)
MGVNMDEKVMDEIENSENYKKLVKERSRFAWKLAGVMLFVYYAFILTIAFSPKTLGASLGGVMTVGIPVGIFIILFAFLLTGVYTWRANSEFDSLTEKIKEELS